MENKNWWEQATMADHNKDIKGTKSPWYNQQSKLGWSILFWPVFVYGFFKTDLIKRKTKQIIGAVVIGLLFMGYLNSDDDSGTNSKRELGSYTKGGIEYYITHKYLRDPDSYEGLEWTNFIVNQDGPSQVTHTFRAKNGFGGMNVETHTFTVDKDGWKVIAVD